VETLRMLGQYGNPGVITIVNPRQIHSIDVTSGVVEYPDLGNLLEAIKEMSSKTRVVNATEEAQRMGSPMFANAILMGALIGAGVLPIDKASVEAVLRETFPKEIETNLAAFNRGFKLVK